MGIGKFSTAISTSPAYTMNLPIQPNAHNLHVQDLQAVMAPIESARGMPNSAYTTDASFTFERDFILGRHWTAIAFADQLEANSVQPLDFMGLPILICKDKAHQVRVFHNVCSHRGMKLVQDERKTNGLIVCPYHSWTYSIGGNLKATPNIGGVGVHSVDGFECADRGLKPIRCHVWMGILFINLDGNAEPFSQSAASFLDRANALMGTDAESVLKVAGADSRLTMSVACNWKLAIENYLEAYHLPFIHPGLNSYSPLDAHHPTIFGDRCSGQITSTFDPGLDRENPFPLLPGWQREHLGTAEYPAIYPNLLLGLQSNHLFAMIVLPESPTSCREDLAIYYVGDAASSDQFADQRQVNMEAWNQVFSEDIEPCERMQVGRQSSGFSGGAFSPVLDICSHHFHQWIARHYIEAMGG